MLAEVAASRISTAELEMQAAPAVAAAVGDIGGILIGTGALPRVMTKDRLR
jgi:hypothetical protein